MFQPVISYHNGDRPINRVAVFSFPTLDECQKHCNELLKAYQVMGFTQSVIAIVNSQTSKAEVILR